MTYFGPFDFADQSPKHMNLCQYVACNVPSLKGFCEQLTDQQSGVYILKALSSVMFSLQGYSNISFIVLSFDSFDLCYIMLYFMFSYVDASKLQCLVLCNHILFVNRTYCVVVFC